MTALLQGSKPKHTRIDRLSHGQEAVVLEQHSFLRSQRLSNIFALLLREHNALEAVVHGVVVVERA